MNLLIKLLSLKMPKNSSKLIYWTLIALSIFGTVMVTSASMSTFTTTNEVIAIWGKQMVFFIVSFLAMIKVSQLFSFNFVKKIEPFLIVLTIGSLLITRFFHTGASAYNWINFGFFTIQPSEFAKVVIMIVISNNFGNLPKVPWVTKKTKISTKESFKRILSLGWAPLLSVILFILIVFFYQGDLGSAVVMMFIALFMLLCAEHPFLGKPQKILLGITLVGALLVLFIISPYGAEMLDNSSFSNNYMVQRITSIYYLFRPENMNGSSLQQVKGLFSFAYGGMNGVGLGNSIQKYGYLPAAPTDYILAIVVEELGIWGFLFITTGYVLLIGSLLMYAMRVTSNRGRLFMIGAATYLFIHYAFNVGGVSAILPLTGIPLLLISQGGSSQLAVFITFGIVQNIIARDNHTRLKKQEELL